MKKLISLFILLVIVGIGYLVFIKKPVVENQQINSIPTTTNTTSGSNTNKQTTLVPEITTNPNMSGGKYPVITVVSPNGGEKIPYGNIVMAGDLGFSWKLQNENFKPTSEFAAYLIDENNAVIRSDFVKYINPLGNSMFTTSFAGERNIQINKKYKIRVCDEVDTRVVKCDESDGYFTVVSQ